MRGRLINPFRALVERIDTVATATTDPDGAGELTSGYDTILREPIRLAPGVVTTRYHAAILLPCQFEPEDIFNAQGQAAGGDDAKSRVRVVFHFSQLESDGLVDATTGDALLRVNDRLLSIHRYDDESLIQKVGPNAQGLYCTEAKPLSFGLSGGARNLLVCTYESRDATFRGGG